MPGIGSTGAKPPLFAGPRLADLRLAGLLAGLLGGLGLLAGCNAFAPLADDKDLTYRGLVLKGNEAIDEGRFADAEAYFDRAKRMNPAGSEAYLYHSKSLMGLYGIDYNTLNDEFESRRNKDGEGKKGIPFIDSGTTLEGIDSIYFPVAQSVENLEHILRRREDTILMSDGWVMPPDGDTAGDGRVSEGVARLDLGLLQTIKGMLPLDLDGDNHIGRECGRNICPDLGEDCMAGADYRTKCREGAASEAKGFANFKRFVRSVDIDSLDSRDLRAREVSHDPNDINGLLDRMQGPIAGSTFNLDSVTGAMATHNQDKLRGQLKEIVTNVSDLSSFLAYMRYNDGLDNDFDGQAGPGAGKRMVWHDFNNDGAIMFDYDDSLDFAGYRGAAINLEGRNIGHPLHRMLRPELYVRFTDPEWLGSKPAGDTSANARKAAMIMHCRTVALGLADNGAAITPELRLELVDSICATYTSILKAEVTPPARSDWISGSAGVDEELIDDRDNDYDGLKDEDARNARGMDDDDDAILAMDMIGSVPDPMVWRDGPGHGNACPDIDTTRAMPKPPFQREFCIGSLEHRIHLARKGGTDSLERYYSGFNKGEGGDRNCTGDFDKLDPLYREAMGLESSGDPEVRLACSYKHIWIAERPADSEWKSGVIGIDEELPDGKDNDGDGWVDEDLE